MMQLHIFKALYISTGKDILSSSVTVWSRKDTKGRKSNTKCGWRKHRQGHILAVLLCARLFAGVLCCEQSYSFAFSQACERRKIYCSMVDLLLRLFHRKLKVSPDSDCLFNKLCPGRKINVVKTGVIEFVFVILYENVQMAAILLSYFRIFQV